MKKTKWKAVFVCVAAIVMTAVSIFLCSGYFFMQNKGNGIMEKLEQGNFKLNNDGTVTLGEGLVSHGFYSKDGALVNPGGSVMCEDNLIKGFVEFQQNKNGTMEYGLILMEDFMQKEFTVENESYDCYRFSLSGEEKIRIGLEIPAEDSTYEMEYLIIPEPDLKNFALESEVEWNNFMATKDVCSSSFLISSDRGNKRVPPVYEKVDTTKLQLLKYQGNAGFELIKSSNDVRVFDSAKGADRACLSLGSMEEKVDAYAVVAFCDWKQVEITEGEYVRCYTSVPDRNSYDEIIFPDIKEDTVYQMFAFELPIELRINILLKQTFRIKLEGR